MGNNAANLFGLEQATTTIDESTTGIVKVIDGATRDTHGGKLWVYDGNVVPW